MKIRSNVKAGIGDPGSNHNQTITRGVRVRTNVKAGSADRPVSTNHNQTAIRGLKVKTNVKAGIIGVL
jgi:hypothetical protein